MCFLHFQKYERKFFHLHIFDEKYTFTSLSHGIRCLICPYQEVSALLQGKVLASYYRSSTHKHMQPIPPKCSISFFAKSANHSLFPVDHIHRSMQTIHFLYCKLSSILCKPFRARIVPCKIRPHPLKHADIRESGKGGHRWKSSIILNLYKGGV